MRDAGRPSGLPFFTGLHMNNYEAKQAARRARFEELAQKASGESQRRYKRASDIAGMIPFGQPILVGHHSERMARAHQKKIAQNMNASCEAQSKAKYYEQRAAAVGNGGISSDDPEAVIKLREELAKLERLHDAMKQANACVRKNDRDGLAALGFSEARITQLFTPDFCGRLGFPDYAIANNGANMRRIRKRLEELSAKPIESSEREIAGVTVREDAEENRVMILFADKPAESVRSILKQCGFKWSPTRGAWVRFLNNAGRASAAHALQQIAKGAQ